MDMDALEEFKELQLIIILSYLHVSTHACLQLLDNIIMDIIQNKLFIL